jgi:hypothetical protein
MNSRPTPEINAASAQHSTFDAMKNDDNHAVEASGSMRCEARREFPE